MHHLEKRGQAPGEHDGECRQDERDKPPLVGVCAVAVHVLIRLAFAASRGSFRRIAGTLQLGDGE